MCSSLTLPPMPHAGHQIGTRHRLATGQGEQAKHRAAGRRAKFDRLTIAPRAHLTEDLHPQQPSHHRE